MKVRYWTACVGLSLTVCLLLSLVIIGARIPLNRTNILHHFFKDSGLKLSIGVLLTGSFIDEEMYAAAKHAIKEQKSRRGKDVNLHIVNTGPTPSNFLLAFDMLWDEGIRVFLTGGESNTIDALCKYLQIYRKPSIIFSPTAFQPTTKCPQLVTLYPDQGALYAAELSRVKENNIGTIIPIVSQENLHLLPGLTAIGKSLGLVIESPLQLHSSNGSLLNVKERLIPNPRAAVWLSLGRNLPQLFTSIGNIIQGHLILVQAHPNDLIRLTSDPIARALAEKSAICTTEWSGSSIVGSITRRHVLGSLQPRDPLVGTLSYDAAHLAMFAVDHQMIDREQLMRLEAVTIPLAGGTTLNDIFEEPTSGFVVLKRLVKQQFIGREVLQESPWLVEGFTEVRKRNRQSWSVIRQIQSPVHIVTNKELELIAKKSRCVNELGLKLTVHDPLSHRRITASWALSDVPQAIMFPNGSPNGFSLQTLCKDVYDTHIHEFRCQGAQSHNDNIVCITVSEDSSNRRAVRSTYNSYDYPVRQKKYQYNRRQEQPGPFSSAFKEIKKMTRHEDFNGLIPQLGGCIGVTGSCAYCFFYLHLFNVSITPAVCFGPCSFLIGLHCSTLVSRSVQLQLDHTVICSELFAQGRLSLSSYFADASYGSRLGKSNPRALRGYQTIAAPLVALMQVSPAVTSAVEIMAQPWIRHMEHEEGLRPEDDDIGSLITRIGLPICCFVSVAIDHIDTIALVTLIAVLRRTRR